MAAMSQRDARAFILLLTAVAAFLVWRPLSAEYGKLREGIQTGRMALAAELSLLEHASKYPDLYQQADSNFRTVMPRVFLEQDNDLATVELQQYVDGVARRSSVLVTQSRNQTATRFANGLRGLQVEIAAESDLEGILKFLNGLETGPRLIQIRSLDLRPGSSESGIESNEKAIKVSANIFGFAIDTAVARGHVQPPKPATRGGGARKAASPTGARKSGARG